MKPCMIIMVFLISFVEREGGHDTEDETEDNAAEPTKVSVKFSKNTASAGESKGPSRATSLSARKKDEEESWIDLTYEYNDPAESEKLFSTQTESDTTPFHFVSQQDYLETLFPKYVETTIESLEEKKKHNPKMSSQQMKNMSLPEQLRVLMINGNTS
jgi:hypothetical protein